MHLARGFLNPVSRDVIRDLASPVDMHRTLLRAFPDGLGEGARSRVGMLYRIDTGRDGGAMVVLQSSVRPDFSRLPARYFRSFSKVGQGSERLSSLEHVKGAGCASGAGLRRGVDLERRRSWA